MKNTKKKDNLLESFKKQNSEINLSKIYGGYVEASIGHKSVKTLLQGGTTISDSVYQPD